jgi:hypothetical protein
VHASIWRFAGDPDVLVDTCPSAEVFRAFVAGEAFAGLRARHGLPEPAELADHPVHRAFVDAVARGA